MSNWLLGLALPFGGWFLVIAFLGWKRGYLPTQASVLIISRTVYRGEEPLVFWLNLLIFLAAGLALWSVAIAFWLR